MAMGIEEEAVDSQVVVKLVDGFLGYDLKILRYDLLDRGFVLGDCH